MILQEAIAGASLPATTTGRPVTPDGIARTLATFFGTKPLSGAIAKPLVQALWPRKKYGKYLIIISINDELTKSSGEA